MTPIFGRRKEPKEVFDENMKKANKLYESPKLWKSSEYKKLLEHIEKAQEIAETVKVDQEDIVWLWSVKGSVFLMGYHKYDKALECYDKALAINPRHEQTLNNRLLVLQKLEKWDEVLENCDKILELIPELRGEQPEREEISLIPGYSFSWERRESEIWGNKGSVLGLLGRVREALSCYDKALELYSDNFAAWMDKALCYESLEKWQEAIDCYDKAIELDPKNTSSWCRKGGAMSQLGRHEEALRCFDRALEINPWDWASLNEKGLALYYLGRYDEAWAWIDDSLEHGPKGPGSVGTLLNKVRLLGTLYGRDLYDLSKQRPEEWAQKEREVEKMHKEIESCLTRAIYLYPREVSSNIAEVAKDWESRGGLEAEPLECEECKAIGSVAIRPLYFGKKGKGWVFFIWGICPHAKSYAIPMNKIKGSKSH